MNRVLENPHTPDEFMTKRIRGDCLTPIHPSCRSKDVSTTSRLGRAVDFIGACVSEVSSTLDFRAKTIFLLLENTLTAHGYSVSLNKGNLKFSHPDFPDFRGEVTICGGTASQLLQNQHGSISGFGCGAERLFGRSNVEVAASIISNLDQGKVPVPLTFERSAYLASFGLSTEWDNRTSIRVPGPHEGGPMPGPQVGSPYFTPHETPRFPIGGTRKIFPESGKG